ncbi:MAG TPA: MEDS domain-containing protein [Thermoanaerobaculia bacterium]|nr:MEDS domain-containing protein [Thermoanaerobaculia bacterium]
MGLRILIADDHAAVRRSVRSLVESHDQWTVCGEAADGQEAVEESARLKPDVVLLDVDMPKMNGLEAARRIRPLAPAAQFLILTMHKTERLHEDARRAGVRKVVSKSEADRFLLAAIESLCDPDMAIPLAGSVVRKQRHIAGFFDSEQERYRVLGPFIADGLARGERAVHIIDGAGRDLHIERLREEGIDASGAEARRQMQLLSWDETYLRGGRFDQYAMVGLVTRLLEEGVAAGYPMTRSIAQMEWAADDPPGAADLIEYETRLNETLSSYTDIVICAYDVTKFPAHVILDVLRGHPAAIVGGILRENPFYTALPVMVEELSQHDI